MADSNGGTAYKGVVLTGPNNFLQWERSVRIQSDIDGTASLFCAENMETIATEPQVPERQILSEKEAALLGTLAMITKTEDDLRDQFLLDIETYALKSQQFESQQKRLRQARLMLIESVDATIQPLVIDKTAKGIWAFCQANFKAEDSMTPFLLHTRLRQLKLSNCKDIQDYLFKVENIGTELESAGEHPSDAFIIAAVLAGLTPAYNCVIEQVHFDASMGSVLSSEHIAKRLLHQEYLITQREQDESRNAENNRNGSNHNNGSDEKKTRIGKAKSYLPCPKCKKRHRGGEEECWFKHPEKNPYIIKRRMIKD